MIESGKCGAQGVSSSGPLRGGIGLRPAHYSEVLRRKPAVSWFEVVSENFLDWNGGGGGPLEFLETIRKDYPVVLHGTALSIGSTDPLDESYLKRLRSLIDRVQPEWVTDHLCWNGVGGERLHDLLPLPYRNETLEHVVERVDRVQNFLRRPIGLENVSSYVVFRDADYGEGAFLSEVARRTGCGILLDVNNVYVSCTNHGWDIRGYLDEVDFSRVWQYHLAGHSHGRHGLIDTHDAPVPDEVWDVYRQCLMRSGPLPALVEWDAGLPELDVLLGEARLAERMEEVICGKTDVTGDSGGVSQSHSPGVLASFPPESTP